MTICPEPMEVEEVDTVCYPNIFATNRPENIRETEDSNPHLIHTQHMNEEERNKIVDLVKKFPEIILKENEPLNCTNLLKHKINTSDKLPVYTKNYKYTQNFQKDVKIEIDKLSIHQEKGKFV